MNKHRMYLDKKFLTSPAFTPVRHQHYIEIDDNGGVTLYDVTQGPQHRHRWNGEVFESDGTHDHVPQEYVLKFIQEIKNKRKQS